eukprot:s3485_g5.t1
MSIAGSGSYWLDPCEFEVRPDLHFASVALSLNSNVHQTGLCNILMLRDFVGKHSTLPGEEETKQIERLNLNTKLFWDLESQAHRSLTAMKWFDLLLVLPLPASGWWCETSDRHGCRGQSRHFVREAAEANPFLAFEDIKTRVTDEPLEGGFSLFEFKSGRHFVEVEPNPFHGIPSGDCRPEVVDWDGDGLLDLIVGIEDEATKQV